MILSEITRHDELSIESYFTLILHKLSLVNKGDLTHSLTSFTNMTYKVLQVVLIFKQMNETLRARMKVPHAALSMAEFF